MRLLRAARTFCESRLQPPRLAAPPRTVCSGVSHDHDAHACLGDGPMATVLLHRLKEDAATWFARPRQVSFYGRGWGRGAAVDGVSSIQDAVGHFECVQRCWCTSRWSGDRMQAQLNPQVYLAPRRGAEGRHARARVKRHAFCWVRQHGFSPLSPVRFG